MNDPSAQIVQTVGAELRAHPYRTLAVAAAVGLILGTRRGASLLLPVVGRVAAAMAMTAIAPLLGKLEERAGP